MRLPFGIWIHRAFLPISSKICGPTPAAAGAVPLADRCSLHCYKPTFFYWVIPLDYAHTGARNLVHKLSTRSTGLLCLAFPNSLIKHNGFTKTMELFSHNERCLVVFRRTTIPWHWGRLWMWSEGFQPGCWARESPSWRSDYPIVLASRKRLHTSGFSE